MKFLLVPILAYAAAYAVLEKHCVGWVVLAQEALISAARPPRSAIDLSGSRVYTAPARWGWRRDAEGVIAQLVERLNGIQEVGGSIPPDSTKSPIIRIATAGWSIAKPSAASFPAAGTALSRYAAVLNGTEINSSFYRPHKPETYARWADSVPEDFRFAVKVPRSITHEARLCDAEMPLARFLGEVRHLGGKLGPLLVQLPPRLAFEAAVAEDFFALLRRDHAGAVICEPRHPSWFSGEAEALLIRHGIDRAVADPPPVAQAAQPGAALQALYLRLHGSPQMYRTAYDDAALDRIAARLTASTAAATWCVFDNTASGAALPNALALLARLPH